MTAKHSFGSRPGPFQGPLQTLVDVLAGRSATPPVDWHTFADLAIRRHRVGPMICEAVLRMDPPGDIAGQFRDSSNAAAMAALLDKGETLRLIKALGEAGCKPVMLKGWPLAEQLYGSASLRHAKDIDLHVAEAEVPRAIACLKVLGYNALPGHTTRMKLAASAAPALIRETNDIALIHPSGRHVELHWRLTHLAGWLVLDQIPDAIASHPIDRSGISVSVPSDQAALIYLSVHGQLHMWGRLKWLADIAHLAKIRGDDALMGDLETAERIGAGRALRIALRLSERVLQTRLPAGWPAATWLERRALDHFCTLIAASGGEPGQSWARMQYHLSVMAFGEGLTQRLAGPRYAVWRNLRLYLAGRRAA